MFTIRTPRDLGAAVRQARRDLDLSQADLAAAAGVSRQWLSAVEGGKRTAEVGLVLRVLDALGLTLSATDQPDALRWRHGWPSNTADHDSTRRARPLRVHVDLDTLDPGL